jgi:hypothetical protein
VYIEKYCHDDCRFVYIFQCARILRSTAGGQRWHSTIIFLLHMWTMMMMTISIIHIYWTFIADTHTFHMFVSFLLKLSKWVITVGIRTYVWIFVDDTADFLYTWLHRWSICLFFSKESFRISGFTQREWILYINVNKNKSRWKSIDTYTTKHLHSIHDYSIC